MVLGRSIQSDKKNQWNQRLSGDLKTGRWPENSFKNKDLRRPLKVMGEIAAAATGRKSGVYGTGNGKPLALSR
ncbi:MAG: hypothetical protein V4540_07825 [Pseudomonadota bacterium]